MAQSSQLDTIIAYLQQHRDTYNRDVLKQRLLYDGAPPDLVDQALAHVYGSAEQSEEGVDAAAPDRQPYRSNRLVADDPAVEHIRAYLEQHRTTYHRDALQQKLLADGHNRDAVNLAMAQVYGLTVRDSPQPVAVPTKNENTLFVVVLLSVLLFNWVISIVLGYLAAATESVVGLLVAGIFLLGLEIAIVLIAWRRKPPVARGVMWALVASIPLFAFGLLLGVCLTILNEM